MGDFLGKKYLIYLCKYNCYIRYMVDNDNLCVG